MSAPSRRELLVGGGCLVGAAALAAMLGRRSGAPQVLGRYSLDYLLTVGLWAAAALALAGSAWRGVDSRRSRVLAAGAFASASVAYASLKLFDYEDDWKLLFLPAFLAVSLFLLWPPGERRRSAAALLAGLSLCLNARHALLLAGLALLVVGAARWIGAALSWPEKRLRRLSLGLSAGFFPLIACETGLALIYSSGRLDQTLVFPKAWETVRLESEAPVRKFRLYGKLHVFNGDGFRREDALPPPREGVYRIAALGDSCTYGYGVSIGESYPTLVEEALSGDYRVEVVNLGRMGDEAEDILGVARKVLPALRPNLVTYGLCMNDFLPPIAEREKEPARDPLSLHLRRVGQIFRERTFVRDLLTRRGMSLADSIGLHEDLYSYLGREYDARERYFLAHMRKVGDLARDLGLPPVLALIVNTDRQHRLSRSLSLAAEKTLQKAGFSVISTVEPWERRRRDGVPMAVNFWDAHPSPQMHRLWADLIVAAIRSDARIRADLAPFAKERK